MENTLRFRVLSKMPPSVIRNYGLWFDNPAGTFFRFLLSLFAAALFIELLPAFGVLMFCCAMWIFYSRIFKVLWSFYRYMYGPTPSELYRGYRKAWRVVKNGPIQKTIKVQQSQNTPQWCVREHISSVIHAVRYRRRCMSLKTGLVSVRPVCTDLAHSIILWRVYTPLVGYTDMEEIRGEQDALQLEVPGMRQYCRDAR